MKKIYLEIARKWKLLTSIESEYNEKGEEWWGDEKSQMVEIVVCFVCHILIDVYKEETINNGCKRTIDSVLLFLTIVLVSSREWGRTSKQSW